MRTLALAVVPLVVICLVPKASAQTWTPLKNPAYDQSPAFYPGQIMLLTDGSVLAQDCDWTDWWKLTPDINGSYINGTWTMLASTPGYGPLYYASQVLPNGNVMTIGGEYNMGNTEIWQSNGYMYDPVLNTWTFIQCPTKWKDTTNNGNTGMGDTGSIVLPNGMVLLANPIPVGGKPQCAIYNPATNLIDTPFTNGKADDNDEEGLTLLPDGRILTVDAWDTDNTEIFNPKTMEWTTAGKTPVFLGDPTSREVGPQVLRYDGKVFCCGARGDTCIYDPKTSHWIQGPSFPKYEGTQLGCEDAPAVLLTNGHVLVQVAPETSANFWQSPSLFYEWDGKKLTRVADNLTSPNDNAYQGVFLMLPTGQVMWCDQTGNIELYQSKGGPKPEWAPTIQSYPTTVEAGRTYTISGTQFNGLSGDSAYGDDDQNETNYPIIRITNDLTHHVFYCREHDPSTMAICTGSQIVSTHFDVPFHLETGPSTIEVVTNGIPSKPCPIMVY